MKIESVRSDGIDYVATEITDRYPSCEDCDFHGDCPFGGCPLSVKQVLKKRKRRLTMSEMMFEMINKTIVYGMFLALCAVIYYFVNKN